MTEQEFVGKIQTKLTTFPRKRDSRNENDSVMDDCGGNVDDAYTMGFDDGESYFAHYIKGFLLDLIDEYNNTSPEFERD